MKCDILKNALAVKKKALCPRIGSVTTVSKFVLVTLYGNVKKLMD